MTVTTPPAPPAPPDGWLLLQLQFPRGRSTARVGVWRRLRKLGALALGATWAVPDEVESREICEWLRRDVAAAGGEALLFDARPADVATSAALARRRRGEPVAEIVAGADLLAPLDRARYRRRRWITRPRPGVDRMASAWLVRRFVDPEAKFEFAEDPLVGPGQAIPFDAYGAELGHQCGLCTFEVLAVRFGVDDPAVRQLGRAVRAVDLREAGPDDAEAAMLDRLVTGLRATHADDAELLESGIALFEALYASAPNPPAARTRRSKRSPSAAKRERKRRPR